MYRKALIGGVTAAAIIGAGGTAMALTGSDTASGRPSSSSTSTAASTHAAKGKHAGKGRDGKLLRRLEHGQLVVRGKGGKPVTVDLIRGTVTAVSSSSITVDALDKTSETFAVSGTTKVRVRQAGAEKSASGKPAKGGTSTIGSVAKGDRVLVTGTGTTSYTANRVVDVKGAK